MFHYLSSYKNNSDILSLFSKAQEPWSFIYYQASNLSLYLLWHFSNLGKNFCLSSIGAQASGVADQWREVPASGIFRIDLKSVSISKSVVLKLYPWKFNSGGGGGGGCGMSEDTLQVFLTDGHMKEVVQQFIGVPSIAVKRRVLCLPRDESLKPSEVLKTSNRKVNIAILFSGGIDSMVITAIADHHIPLDEPTYLLNVAFMTKEKTIPVNFNKKGRKQKNHCEIPSEEFSKTIPAAAARPGEQFNVPGRVTGRAGLRELQAANPSGIWNFVEINPLDIVLDDSIGCAVWFASGGAGWLVTQDGEKLYHSSAKVVLTGIGIEMELDRISSRNLGHDDRRIIWGKANLTLPCGIGEKLILRLAAVELGQTASVLLTKWNNEKALDKCGRLQIISLENLSGVN
ncbi:hypothetical protein FD754_021760 [Muntiacus muntjak]|uniref:Asparagine synthetase domain-containing protein 1 n=1 Tax=Muntiacus muntjak TaxID=9888 RepID=A0A5N3V6N7_MUNMU|nr:hypothetical protein FD754_021760 [Muntiacus muntjak]